jgi:tetratricopeptide (TPR) repeat protein
VALDPEYAFAYSGLGTAHALLFISTSNPDDIVGASRYLERAIELDPELAEPYPWLNNIRFRKNDIAGAVAAGRKAIELQPDLPEAHYFYGGLHYMMPEIEPGAIWQGASHVAQALRLQPNFHAGWLVLGGMAMFTGKHSDAIRILNEAVRLEAETNLRYRFEGSRTLLAIAISRSGDWEQAREQHHDALESLRGTEHVYTTCFQTLSWCCLGEIELRRGDPAAALAQFRRARRMITESRRIVGSPRLLIRVNAGLAAAYAASGDIDRASELAIRAAEDLRGPAGLPQNVTFECSVAQLWLSLAVAEVRLGRIKSAVAHLSRARDTGWLDVVWLRADPELRPLAGDPAFDAFVDELDSHPQRDFPAPE